MLKSIPNGAYATRARLRNDFSRRIMGEAMQIICNCGPFHFFACRQQVSSANLFNRRTCVFWHEKHHHYCLQVLDATPFGGRRRKLKQASIHLTVVTFESF
mmetsp:Transcript_5002/g.14557  ORF Transcript_5002/g.14557 Transcript_5002/m.14557 type:complete len:101 (-) Transcript_5002:317-619(-)